MSELSRRGFLGSTAAMATASALGSRGQAAGDAQTLNIALIGAGGQGQRILEFALKNPGVRCVTLCDILPIRFQEAERAAGVSAKHYTDWHDMLDKEDLDAVLIGLPEHVHHPAAVASMKAGCHVFCEKPMAYSLDEGKDMIRVRNETGKVLQVGQQRRANPVYYYAVELLQQKKLVGDLVRIDAFWDRWEDWKRPLPSLEIDLSKWGYPSLDHLINWRLYRKYGHGLMTENGTHQLDAASWLLGGRRPRQVCGFGVTQYNDGRETHDLVSANYLFDDEIVVRFHQDFHQGFNYGWQYGELVLGTHGSLRITNQHDLVYYKRGERDGRPLSVAELNGGKGIELPGVKLTGRQLAEIESSRKDAFLWFGYEAEMRSFVHCCRTGETPPCTAEIGHNSIVPTIVGTEAQFERKVLELRDQWWA